MGENWEIGIGSFLETHGQSVGEGVRGGENGTTKAISTAS